MTAPRDFLLDTSILLHLIRGNATGLAVDATYGLRASLQRPLISVITVGETLALARRLRWGTEKQQRLLELLGELVIVDIRREPILQRYAEIDTYLVQHGHKIGDNDTWIAATAAATGATLLTSDKDFDALDSVFLTRTYIEPK